jgi:Protein of unknown function (DUF3433)
MQCPTTVDGTDPTSNNVLSPSRSTSPVGVANRNGPPSQTSPSAPTQTASQAQSTALATSQSFTPPSSRSLRGSQNPDTLEDASSSLPGSQPSANLASASSDTSPAQPTIGASIVASTLLSPTALVQSVTTRPLSQEPISPVSQAGLIRTLTTQDANVQPSTVPGAAASTSASSATGNATNRALNLPEPGSMTGSVLVPVPGGAPSRTPSGISLHTLPNISQRTSAEILPNGHPNSHPGTPTPSMPNTNVPQTRIPNGLTRGSTTPSRVLKSSFRQIGQVMGEIWERMLDVLARRRKSLSVPPKEWRSWKIKWAWLSFLLFIEVSLIVVVATLNAISQKSSGFVRLQSPPTFLAKHPALAKAIWSQGILYTALPAFLMTIYRMMWESAVTAFADRQPYVDLKKSRGGSAEATIMLDYRAFPAIWAWAKAFQNGHLLLSACMFLSLVLSLAAVPLTSFLFTDASFKLNNTFPLSFTTSFDEVVFPELPNFRQTLEFAAAMRIYDGSAPPWTHEEYAFPRFNPLSETGTANLSVETTAYSAYLDCKTVPSSEYNLTRVESKDTPIPAEMFMISAQDRDCAISSSFALQHRSKVLKSSVTIECSMAAHRSRLIIVSASTQGISQPGSDANISLISCIPSYWQTPGTLTVMNGLTTGPLIRSFSPSANKEMEFRPETLWRTFETELQNLICYEPTVDIDSNDFGRYVYSLAAKNNPSSPLDPRAITDAISVLFAACFAVLSSTQLFKPMLTPKNSTGISSTPVSRIIVVPPVAYTIIVMLTIIAVLNIGLFLYSRRESILLEEPAGLVAHAGILHGSDDIKKIVEEVKVNPTFDGRTLSAVKRLCNLEQTSCSAVRTPPPPLQWEIKVQHARRQSPGP